MDKKSFAVIGAGAFGSSVAEALFQKGCEVMVIDKDETIVQDMADKVTYSVCLDSRDEQALKSVGIRNYHTAIICIGENITDSTLTTMMLKELGVERIVCKALNAAHKKLLEKVGADIVVIPEHDMGVRLAKSLASGNLVDYIELSKDFSMAEVEVPASWVGKTIADIDVRKKYNVTIIGFKNGENVSISPDPSHIFLSGDIIMIVGETLSIDMISNLD